MLCTVVCDLFDLQTFIVAGDFKQFVVRQAQTQILPADYIEPTDIIEIPVEVSRTYGLRYRMLCHAGNGAVWKWVVLKHVPFPRWRQKSLDGPGMFPRLLADFTQHIVGAYSLIARLLQYRGFIFLISLAANRFFICSTYIFSFFTARLVCLGLGFAIPIDQATEVMNQLIEGKYIARGYLGIMMQPLNTEIREYIDYKEGDGVYVRAVVRGSPAQKAGILPGDVITKINGTPIKDDRMALRLVANLKPNKSYPIDIFRKGEHASYTITAAERKQTPTDAKAKDKSDKKDKDKS